MTAADQPTPRVGDSITTAAADSLPVGSVIGYVGGAAHREYQGARPVWRATNGGIYHSAKALLHERGPLTVLYRPDGDPLHGGGVHRAVTDHLAAQRGGEAVDDDPMPPEGIVREEVDWDDWSEAMVALLPGDYDGDPRDVIEAVMRRAAGGEAVDREALIERHALDKIGGEARLIEECRRLAAHPNQIAQTVPHFFEMLADVLVARGDTAPSVSAEQRDAAVWALIEHDGTWYDGDPSQEHHDERVGDVTRVLAVLGIEVR